MTLSYFNMISCRMKWRWDISGTPPYWWVLRVTDHVAKRCTSCPESWIGPWQLPLQPGPQLFWGFQKACQSCTKRLLSENQRPFYKWAIQSLMMSDFRFTFNIKKKNNSTRRKEGAFFLTKHRIYVPRWKFTLDSKLIHRLYSRSGMLLLSNQYLKHNILVYAESKRPKISFRNRYKSSVFTKAHWNRNRQPERKTTDSYSSVCVTNIVIIHAPGT